MILSHDIINYETTNLLSNNTHKVMDSICKNLLNVPDVEGNKIKTFELNGQTYSFIISQKDLFTSDDDLSPEYAIFAVGEFEDKIHLKNNLDSIVLSFPLWSVTEEQMNEIKELKAIKSLFVDQGYYSSFHYSYNPKFISSNHKFVLPILDVLNTAIEDKDIVDTYKTETNQSFSNFVSVLENVKKASIDLKGTDEWEEYVDAEYPILFFVVQDKEIYVHSTSSHTHIVLNDNSEYSCWYINGDSYYQYDELDNNLFEQGLYAEDVLSDTEAFYKWLTTKHESPELIFKKEGEVLVSSHDSVLSELLASLYIRFSNELNCIKEMCQYDKVYYSVNNADEFFSFDLEHSCRDHLIGWIFLGSNSFQWKNGVIVNTEKTIPYSLLKTPLVEKDDSIEPVGELNYIEALITSVPDDIEDSFKPIVKEAFNMIKSNKYKNVRMDEEKIKELEETLIEKKII